MARISEFVVTGLFLGSAALAAGAPAEKVWSVDSASKVTFLAVGKPSFMKIQGEGAKPSGSLTTKKDTVSGTVTVNLEEFATGIALRDKHMKEKYLETGKSDFKNAVVKIEDAPASCIKAGQECELKGTLTLHGKTVPFEKTRFKVEDGGGSLRVHSEFPLDLAKFEIAVPSFSGITVANEVTVSADLVLK